MREIASRPSTIHPFARAAAPEPRHANDDREPVTVEDLVGLVSELLAFVLVSENVPGKAHLVARADDMLRRAESL